VDEALTRRTGTAQGDRRHLHHRPPIRLARTRLAICVGHRSSPVTHVISTGAEGGMERSLQNRFLRFVPTPVGTPVGMAAGEELHPDCPPSRWGWLCFGQPHSSPTAFVVRHWALDIHYSRANEYRISNKECRMMKCTVGWDKPHSIVPIRD